MPNDSMGDSLDRTGAMSPMDEIEAMDLRVELAGLDEHDTMFDPGTHPKPPGAKEEAVTDEVGGRTVDIMEDTPPIDDLTLTGAFPEPGNGL